MCWHEGGWDVEHPDGELFNRIIHGNSLNELGKYPADCVDLIFTSPPYADSRKKTYGGIHPDNYVEWFLPFVDQFRRVLKSKGSFVTEHQGESSERGAAHRKSWN